MAYCVFAFGAWDMTRYEKKQLFKYDSIPEIEISFHILPKIKDEHDSI